MILKSSFSKLFSTHPFPLVHLTGTPLQGVPGDGDGVPGDPDGDEAATGGTTLGEPAKTKGSLED